MSVIGGMSKAVGRFGARPETSQSGAFLAGCEPRWPIEDLHSMSSVCWPSASVSAEPFAASSGPSAVPCARASSPVPSVAPLITLFAEAMPTPRQNSVLDASFSGKGRPYWASKASETNARDFKGRRKSCPPNRGSGATREMANQAHSFRAPPIHTKIEFLALQ